MKCERCNVEMEKYELEPPYATFGRTYYPLNSKYGGEPILGRSVYICSECGKIECKIKRVENYHQSRHRAALFYTQKTKRMRGGGEWEEPGILIGTKPLKYLRRLAEILI